MAKRGRAPGPPAIPSTDWAKILFNWAGVLFLVPATGTGSRTSAKHSATMPRWSRFWPRWLSPRASPLGCEPGRGKGIRRGHELHRNLRHEGLEPARTLLHALLFRRHVA